MNAELEPLLKLGRAERIQLVEDLWYSIAREQPALPVADWKRKALRQRKESFQKSSASGLTWEQVQAKARGAND